jgi:DNA replication and repair protein RecF
MILRTLYLHNFRKFTKSKIIYFSPSINVFYGKNAQGKTTILEAIYLLSTGRSFKTNKLQELIQENKSHFYIEAQIEKDQAEHTIKIYYDKSKKKLQYNSTSYTTFTPLFGLMPSTLSAPMDSLIISHSPNIRRKFLNLHICQYNNLYIHHYSRFIKALKNRNELLKQNSLQTIGVWENQLAISCAFLTYHRNLALIELEKISTIYLKKLSTLEKSITLKYISPIKDLSSIDSITNQYLDLFKQFREKEVILKTTLHSPLKDDFLISIEKKDARCFASEGQKKTISCALRLAQWKDLKNKKSIDPIMNIDDFDIFLDEIRKKNFCNLLKDLSQVFITTTSNKLDFPATSFLIENGTISNAHTSNVLV